MDKLAPYTETKKRDERSSGARGQPAPSTIPSVAEAVNINVVPSTGKTSLHGGSLRVALEITCKPDQLRSVGKPKKNRIVLILDISGSMSAYMCNLKTSAGHVISTCCTDADEALIVTFSDNGTVAHQLSTMGAQGGSSVLKVINGLTAGGQTNASAGLELAFANIPNDDVQTTGFFFSDGQFNLGITDPAQLRELMARLIGKRPIVMSVIALSPNPQVAQMEAVMSHGAKFTYAKGGTDLQSAFADAASLSRDVSFANAGFTVSDATRMKHPIPIGAIETKKTETLDITAPPQDSAGRHPAAEFVFYLGGERIKRTLMLDYVDGEPPPEPLPQVFKEADLMSQCQREFAKVSANPALAAQSMSELSRAAKACGGAVATQVEQASVSVMALSKDARTTSDEAKSFSLQTASITQRVKRSF